MVQGDPKLLDVSGSIAGREISSLLDRGIVRWTTTFCALMLACQPSVSQKKRKNIYIYIYQMGARPMGSVTYRESY